MKLIHTKEQIEEYMKRTVNDPASAEDFNEDLNQMASAIIRNAASLSPECLSDAEDIINAAICMVNNLHNCEEVLGGKLPSGEVFEKSNPVFIAAVMGCANTITLLDLWMIDHGFETVEAPGQGNSSATLH